MSTTPNPLAQFYKDLFREVVDEVLAERNANFPAVDAELAGQLAKINAKIYVTVPEAAVLLNCSESHLYTKISDARKKKAASPIPFLDLDGVYTFERERLLAWATLEKDRKAHLKSIKGGA